MSDIINILLLSTFSSVIALGGGVVFLYNKKLSHLLQKHSVPFAAGVMITVSLLGLIPEAIQLIGERSLWYVLLSFFSAYFFEHFLFDLHHHHDDHHHRKKVKASSVPLVIIGDTIHNFIDGVTIGSSYLLNPGLGLITALSTFLHEVPHEIGDFGLLLKAGWNRKKILIVNILSASTTILGALLLLIFNSTPNILGTLLAISAGIFLYLGSIDFLPHVKDEFQNKFYVIIPLSLGIIIMVATLNLIPHSHDTHDQTQNLHQDGNH